MYRAARGGRDNRGLSSKDQPARTVDEPGKVYMSNCYSVNARQVTGVLPLSITIAVLEELRRNPSWSIGRNPSKGGSATVHILEGSFGELRPEGAEWSLIADGAMVDFEARIGERVKSWVLSGMV